MKKEKTRVKFIKFKEGDVIALFPDEIADTKGNIMSYQHIGQHGGASKDLLHYKRATFIQYKDLAKELENIGYNIVII